MLKNFSKIFFIIVILVICFLSANSVKAATIVDSVAGATHAYGLRQLKSSYTSPLVRIRRTDGEKADVSADAQGNVSSTSPVTVVSGSSTATVLSDFIVGTDAFVEIWYDQVGSNNVQQLTTTLQPKIVSSGSIITAGANNKPTAQFDGSDDNLTTASTLSFSQPFTIFIVSTGSTQTGAFPRLFEIGVSPNRALYQLASGGGMYSGTFLTTTVQSTPYTARVMTMVFNSTSSQLFTNGTSVASGDSGSNTISGTGVIAGGSATNYFFKGEISEFIIYGTTLSASDRQAIETDESNFFLNGSTPTITVQAATNVTATTATLNGNITATGGASATIEGFNYGTTTEYGSTVSSTGTYGVGAYSLGVSGLVCGTTYHFRAYATNPSGTGTSGDQTLTTSACPTALGVSGATQAYGLRQLITSYSSALIKIRRTDGEEADVSADSQGNVSATSPITVVSGSSTATALSDFIVGTDAFVEIWYDQVGSNNVVQATQSQQPKIVSSGVLITSGANNRPAVQFDGIDDTLTTAGSIALSQPFTTSVVSAGNSQSSGTARIFKLGTSPTNAVYQVGSSGGMYSGTFLSTTVQPTPYSTNVMTMSFNSTNSQLFTNGTSVASGDSGSQNVSGPESLASNGSGFYFNGYISEFIIYDKTLSTSERQTVENNQLNNYINTPAITISTPSRAVSAEPQVATISYVDQKGETVSIPYIQTSTTLNTIASATGGVVPAGGGIKFVLNEGLLNETITYDMTSPYSVNFTGLAKGTYTLDVYVVDSSQAILSGSNYHDKATSIGIGDIYIAIGDSITKGAGGTSNTSCVASGNINNWTQSLPGTVSTDKRNFCQWSLQQPMYFKSWMPELNNELEAYLGYPVFILNEGYGGYAASGYLSNPMGLAAWQSRVSGLHPNKWLVLLGTNDSSDTTTFINNMTAIVNEIKTTYGAASTSIYLGLPLYAASRPVVQTYITPLQNLVATGNLGAGPNFNAYFYNHPELYFDNPPIHPTVNGYLQMARQWALSIIKPKNVVVSQNSGTVTVNWDSLAAYDSIPTGSSNLSGYYVKYGTSTGVYGTTIDAGNVTTKNITGLNNNQQYFFTVQAYGTPADLDVSGLATEASLTYANTRTLTYTAGAHGSITGASPQTVNYGTDGSAVTAVADSGYHFVNWSDSSTANPRTDTNVTANISVTANFEITAPTTYTITPSAGSNGSISPSGATTVNSGDNQAFTITANSGYHISDVLVDGSSVGAVSSYQFTNVTADHTISAAFDRTSSGGGGCYGCFVNPVVPSGGFKMSINGGASTTASRNVFLGFNAGTDIKKMAISMTGDFTDASQENYTTSKQWDLCSKFGGAVKNPTCPDGKYIVYAKFYTTYGRSSDTSVASSTITLKSAAVTENLQQYANLPFSNPFTKNLQYRQTNNDVKRLQIFLNSDRDTKIADTGEGSPGKETNYFGTLTYKAVIKFQEKYAKDILVPWGFAKGTGYIGKTTLAKINELMKNK